MVFPIYTDDFLNAYFFNETQKQNVPLQVLLKDAYLASFPFCPTCLEGVPLVSTAKQHWIVFNRSWKYDVPVPETMIALLIFIAQPWHSCKEMCFLCVQEVHSSHWHQEMEAPLRVHRHCSRCRKISTRAIEPCSNEEMGWDSEGPWLCPRHPQSLSSPVSWKLLTWQSTVNQKWQPLLSHLIFAAQGPKVKSSLERRSREDVFSVFDRAWPFHCYSTNTL